MGDIVQAMNTIAAVKKKNSEARIVWVTKEQFKSLVLLNPLVDEVLALEKGGGAKALFLLAQRLVQAIEGDGNSREVIFYDAHQNLRSRIFRIFIAVLKPRLALNWITRSKERWKRFLLFQFRINHFPNPYKGAWSYLAPLQKKFDGELTFSPSPWKFLDSVGDKWNTLFQNFKWVRPEFIALAPSAAWEMKRWPVEHWKKLITLLPDHQFCLLGGPEDHFLHELESIAPQRVVNLAGKLSLSESAYAISKAKLLISADTGLIHIADAIGVKGISLMGPTAFGFCSGNHITTLGVDLPCRPCTKDGRGQCERKIYQECMVAITPEMVAAQTHQLLS